MVMKRTLYAIAGFFALCLLLFIAAPRVLAAPLGGNTNNEPSSYINKTLASNPHVSIKTGTINLSGGGTYTGLLYVGNKDGIESAIGAVGRPPALSGTTGGPNFPQPIAGGRRESQPYGTRSDTGGRAGDSSRGDTGRNNPSTGGGGWRSVSAGSGGGSGGGGGGTGGGGHRMDDPGMFSDEESCEDYTEPVYAPDYVITEVVPLVVKTDQRALFGVNISNIGTMNGTTDVSVKIGSETIQMTKRKK